MAREREAYRDNVALLNEIFPDKGMLDVDDTAKYLGVGRRAADSFVRNHGVKIGRRYFISKGDLARHISSKKQ